MQLISFRQSYERISEARAGVLLPYGVVDLQAAAPLVFEREDSPLLDMRHLLEGGDEGLGIYGASEIVNAVLEQMGGEVQVVRDPVNPEEIDIAGIVSIGGAELLLPRSAVKLLAPLPRPGSIRLFNCFEGHVNALFKRAGRALRPQWRETPMFVWGNHQAVVGPDEAIALPRSNELDFGLMVGAVIGRQGRDVAAEDVWDYVAGFTILNDFVARDVELAELKVGLGGAKARDFAIAMGPVIVTLEELEDYVTADGHQYQLEMVTRINGRTLSQGRLDHMVFDWGQLIELASRGTTLYPGDILAAGPVDGGSVLGITPEVVGGWLEPDDIVEVEVSGLGVLKNRIVYQ
ncbi:MAG: fumarylacetoacetate hydrolase family protein [Herpetosiphon sp.]